MEEEKKLNEEELEQEEVQNPHTEEEIREAQGRLDDIYKEYKYYSTIVQGLGICLGVFIILAVTGFLSLVPIFSFIPGIVLMGGWLAICIPITKMLISKRMRIGSFFYWDSTEYVTETTWSDGSKTTTSDGGMASMAFSIMINVLKVMMYFFAAMVLSLIYPFITLPRKAKKICKEYGLETFDYKAKNRFILKWGAIGFAGVAGFAAVVLTITAIVNNVGNAETKTKMVSSLQANLNAEDYVVELYGQDLRISYSASTGIATITTGINVNDNWFEKGYRLDASKVYQYDVKNNKAIGETDETIVKTLHDMLPNYNVNFGEALNNIKKTSISKVATIKYYNKNGEKVKAVVYNYNYNKVSCMFLETEAGSNLFYLAQYNCPVINYTAEVVYTGYWYQLIQKGTKK